MTTLLAIDTAAPRLQLALLMPGGVDVHREDLAKGHAEVLFDRIAMLLGRNGVSYDALTRVAATTGPGSFTGLRIGLSAARGFGVALGVPVLGISSLVGLSLSGELGEPLVVRLDARRDEHYRQAFSAPGLPASGPEAVPEDQAEVAGTTVILGPFVDIGALASFAAEADPASFPPEALYIRDADAKPQDKARIARLGDER